VNCSAVGIPEIHDFAALVGTNGGDYRLGLVSPLNGGDLITGLDALTQISAQGFGRPAVAGNEGSGRPDNRA
jgi:hypothetical protein